MQISYITSLELWVFDFAQHEGKGMGEHLSDAGGRQSAQRKTSQGRRGATRPVIAGRKGAGPRERERERGREGGRKRRVGQRRKSRQFSLKRGAPICSTGRNVAVESHNPVLSKTSLLSWAVRFEGHGG